MWEYLFYGGPRISSDQLRLCHKTVTCNRAEPPPTMPSLDFSNEPKDRPKTLHVHQAEPFNAEPEDLREFISYPITPLHLVYGRNHGPIPDVKADDYRLTINGLVKNGLALTLSDIKKMPRTEVVTALQVFSFGRCGNRSVPAIVAHPCRKSVKRRGFHGRQGPSQTAPTLESKSRISFGRVDSSQMAIYTLRSSITLQRKMTPHLPLRSR